MEEGEEEKGDGDAKTFLLSYPPHHHPPTLGRSISCLSLTRSLQKDVNTTVAMPAAAATAPYYC